MKNLLIFLTLLSCFSVTAFGNILTQIENDNQDASQFDILKKLYSIADDPISLDVLKKTVSDKRYRRDLDCVLVRENEKEEALPTEIYIDKRTIRKSAGPLIPVKYIEKINIGGITDTCFYGIKTKYLSNEIIESISLKDSSLCKDKYHKKSYPWIISLRIKDGLIVIKYTAHNPKSEKNELFTDFGYCWKN